ncbi:unnamed protein product [Menidia menidia]|uniref:(Atlantic silverside) hypothetical protein n=1 Tax=Menidia menidia TaxID=238744 RepID=A0A8S4AC15_9TELE|nr:unnamed protein product [Menidia menidia]
MEIKSDPREDVPITYYTSVELLFDERKQNSHFLSQRHSTPQRRDSHSGHGKKQPMQSPSRQSHRSFPLDRSRPLLSYTRLLAPTLCLGGGGGDSEMIWFLVKRGLGSADVPLDASTVGAQRVAGGAGATPGHRVAHGHVTVLKVLHLVEPVPRADLLLRGVLRAHQDRILQAEERKGRDYTFKKDSVLVSPENPPEQKICTGDWFYEVKHFEDCDVAVSYPVARSCTCASCNTLSTDCGRVQRDVWPLEGGHVTAKQGTDETSLPPTKKTTGGRGGRGGKQMSDR